LRASEGCTAFTKRNYLIITNPSELVVQIAKLPSCKSIDLVCFNNVFAFLQKIDKVSQEKI